MKFTLLMLLAAGSLHAESPAQFYALQAQVAALQKEVAALQQNKALALAPFVSVDTNPENGLPGPHVTFTGCNLHVVNGMGQTSLTNGRGNILVGYDEDPLYATQFYDILSPGLSINADTNQAPLKTGDRNGSHNLIIGRWHRFTTTSFGGLVAGELNTITNEADSIIGGAVNRTNDNGSLSTIVGGAGNGTGAGSFATILGGEYCATGGATFSTVVGGYSNHAQFYYAVTLGGLNNICGGEFSVILGGPGSTFTAAQSISPN